MALIVFTDGTRRIIRPEQALKLWRVMNGEVSPTQEQRMYCMRIRDLYLNLRNAPQSYLDKYPSRRLPTDEPIPYTQATMFPNKRN